MLGLLHPVAAREKLDYASAAEGERSLLEEVSRRPLPFALGGGGLQIVGLRAVGTAAAPRHRGPLQRYECQFPSHLIEQDYPAGECISTPTSSSQTPKACILVTKFASGHHPEHNRATFLHLSQRLGQLHNMHIPDNAPKGGAWDHLVIAGDIRDEYSATAQMLSDFEARMTPADQEINPFSGEV